jgi:curved DNA-binding protein CbpA
VRGLPEDEEQSRREAEVDERRIAERHRQAREADYFTLLGLSRRCTGYEVRQAYERLARELQPGRFPILSETDRARLEEIRQVAEEAFDVLREDALREAYARHLPGG